MNMMGIANAEHLMMAYLAYYRFYGLKKNNTVYESFSSLLIFSSKIILKYLIINI